MATGDQGDFVTRLRRLLPNGWFPDAAPVLSGILAGIAASLSDVYGLIAYARLQTRIATATDAFLDLISADFFGGTLPRKAGETDTQFRGRIQAQLLLERGTRAGLIKALTLLTGRKPLIIEPADVRDVGAYDTPTLYYDEPVGYYGSRELPNQVFLIAYRPYYNNTMGIAPYDSPLAFYDSPYYAYADMANSSITDADIYTMIDSMKPLNTIVWTLIQS